MIGLILAAGKGSRLGNLTEKTPKSLLPLNETETILDYNLNVLIKLGIKKIIIVTGFEADKIKGYVLKFPQVEFVFNPFWNSCNVLGSLYMALPYLNEDFLFLHADTLVDFTVWEKLIETEGDFVLPYKNKACGEEEMKVKHDSKGILREITKDMPCEQADGEFLGIAKFSKDTLKYIGKKSEELLKGSLNLYMESVLQEAIQDNKNIVTFSIGDAKFVEIDFFEDYQLAKASFSAK